MKKEIWIEHKSNTQGTSFKKFEISNFGRLKIYNDLSPEGRITDGTLVSGVPSYVYKTYNDVPEKEASKLKEIDEAFQFARQMVAKYRYQPEKLADWKKKRDKLRERKKKQNKVIHKLREIPVILIIHRLVAKYFLEKPEDKEAIFVIHKDFDKTNNHVDNLSWATQEMINARQSQQPKNILRRFKMQLNNIPYPPRNMKLSENDVLYIKKRLKKNDNIEKLAQKFDVSTSTINDIKKGKTWKNVKLVEDLVEEKKNKKWQAT